MPAAWCSICRGEDDLEVRCSPCGRRFHKQCLGLSSQQALPVDWRCESCLALEELEGEERERHDAFVASQKALSADGRALANRRSTTLLAKSALLEPFVPAAKLEEVRRAARGKEKGKGRGGAGSRASNDSPKQEERLVDTQPSFVTATLRDYQARARRHLP